MRQGFDSDIAFDDSTDISRDVLISPHSFRRSQTVMSSLASFRLVATDFGEVGATREARAQWNFIFVR